MSGLLAGYVAIRTGGRASATITTKMTYDAQGMVKTVEETEKVVYIDPLSGFGHLLQRLLSGKKFEPETAQA